MGKRLSVWWASHGLTKRRLIQVYAALLYNAHAKGFIQGDIYTGPIKNLCVPGLNCYSCPGAIGACPLGALQNALAATGSRAPWYVLGILLLFGLTLGRTICGWLCPMGLIQELLHKIPTPKLKKSRITRALSYLKYGVLIVFALALPLIYAARRVPLPAFCKYICPAGTLEGAVGLLANPANADKLSMLGVLFTRKLVILIVILAACVFIYRAFCRFLCPLGAMACAWTQANARAAGAAWRAAAWIFAAWAITSAFTAARARRNAPRRPSASSAAKLRFSALKQAKRSLRAR